MSTPSRETAGRTTLRNRLRGLIVLTSAVALVCSSGSFLAYDYFSSRNASQNRLLVLTEVMATQTSPALAFNDPKVASEILGTLSAAPHIVGAAVYTRSGALFNRYLRADTAEQFLPASPVSDGAHFIDGQLGLARPILVGGERLGTIYLRSDLEDLHQRLRLNALIVLGTLVVILMLSYVLSTRMIGAINGPIASLVGIVRAVTTSRDYSLRADRKGPEELVLLIDGINDMFSQIQVRDGALQLARNELENRVNERTAELTFVNQELSAEISERKRMEASLRESEERYRQLVELSPDAIMLHREGRIVFVNGAALRLFGARSPDDLLNRPLLDLVAPEYHEAVRARIRKIAEENQTTTPMEQKLVRLDGSFVDVEAQGTPFIYQGRPAVQVVIRDISKRKEIERMKDEFVSTVSHELRTPLTSIQGSLGLIANGVMGAMPVGARPLVDIAYKNCSRLVLLINDILDSEKIAAGKMVFAFKEQEVMPLLEHAVESNRAFGAPFGVRFEIGAAVPGAKVEMDHDRLIQVLTNLLSNAAKFSPKGDVVTISAVRAGSRIRISVGDHGPGIPPEFCDRIFQKFSQADSSDRRAKGGTGLGLSISKAIVEKHGGSISFESEVGKGTIFSVELPERIPPTAPAPAATPRPRVLVCDDEPNVSEIIRVVLEREGFDVELTGTLEETRQALRRRRPDLLSLDFILPDGNGVELLRELRGSDMTKTLPVIVVSPLAQSAREMAGPGLGPVEFLEKPIDLPRLSAAARAAIPKSPISSEGVPT
ncbi:MAG TPA: ATP-binding protein [Planctomycetota bacterium]|nr:ATP-binding protein [Planctomycetota bacterium]